MLFERFFDLGALRKVCVSYTPTLARRPAARLHCILPAMACLNLLGYSAAFAIQVRLSVLVHMGSHSPSTPLQVPKISAGHSKSPP